MSESPSPEVLEEAALPELSDDSFTLNGQIVKIMPLKIKYQKQFAKAFAPIVESMAVVMASDQVIYYTDEEGKAQSRPKSFSDFGVSDFFNLGYAIINNVEVVPRLIQILCHNGGYAIINEDLDESTIQPEEQYRILFQYMRKSGKIQQEIADFFESALSKGLNELAKVLNEAKKAISAETPMNTIG